MHWGMVIDLRRCTGCYACVLACKAEHSTPSGIHFRQVHFQEVGEYPHARRVHVPVQCNHCREPPCVPVCPTGATYKRADGLVLVDQDMCIGCAYCMEACPYEHRHFVETNLAHFASGLTPSEKAGGEAGHDWKGKLGAVVEGPGHPNVAVFIRDPEQLPAPSIPTLRMLFGFTLAEAALAKLLAEGPNLDEAGARLGISRNTVKSRLGSIFAKTGVKRQSSLVRVLLDAIASM